MCCEEGKINNVENISIKKQKEEVEKWTKKKL